MITFLVDDIIFLNPVPPLLSLFNSNTHIKSAQLRLNPLIYKNYNLKKLDVIDKKLFNVEGDDFFTYDQSQILNPGSEWNLAFDLTGGTYRVNFLKDLLKDVEFTNPNTLELNVQTLIPLGSILIPSVEILKCLVLNRVQTVYETRVETEYSVSELFDLWEEGIVINFNEYRYRNTIHVDGLHLIKNDELVEHEEIRFNILIPIKNTPLKYVKQCVESLRKFDTPHCSIIVISDYDELGGCSIFSENLKNVRVIDNEGEGLVDALNTGLKYCGYDYIVRLDADDIITSSDRIINQINYMKSSNLKVCGSSFTVINDNSEIIRTQVQTCNPTFIKYGMLFSNLICHPSVIFEKEYVSSNLGGYGEGKCEDYKLWCEVLKGGGRVGNWSEFGVR